jgi:hypothetical protein
LGIGQPVLFVRDSDLPPDQCDLERQQENRSDAQELSQTTISCLLLIFGGAGVSRRSWSSPDDERQFIGLGLIKDFWWRRLVTIGLLCV